MSDLPGDHFDYDSVPMSVAVLVKHYNKFVLEGIELDRQIEALKVELKRCEAAQDDVRAAIYKLGFAPMWQDGGLMFKCSAENQ